jgi:hypothetical protein
MSGKRSPVAMLSPAAWMLGLNKKKKSKSQPEQQQQPAAPVIGASPSYGGGF